MNFENERWKFIEGFPEYMVSDMGRIKSFKRGKEIIKKPSKCTGYCVITLNMGKKLTHKKVHRLVYEAFVGDIGDYYINHKNNIRSDNRLSNLEKVTQQENISHYHINTTGLKCVKFREGMGWVARITLDGKRCHIGCYETQDQALTAYKNVQRFMGIQNKYS